MSNIIPARGPLTDALFAHMTEALKDFVLVGDGLKPAGAGWQAAPGEEDPAPQHGSYQPYVVLGTGDAVLREQQSPPTLRQAMRAWACGYTLDFYGAARAQADDVADAARAAAVSFDATEPLELGEHTWSVTAVRFSRFGAIKPAENEDPPVWSGADLFAVWIDLDSPGR